MPRIPEPELMDEATQARAYSDADFSQAHQPFIDHIASRLGPLSGEVLDVGCGPADPTVRLALANPDVTILGVDAGPNMLELARVRVQRAGLDDRIQFQLRHLPDSELEAMRFDVVVSNSLLHHLSDPMILWQTVARCTKPEGAVAVMDLMRPADEASTDQLVATYAADAPDVLRADFRNSLRAAYTVDEVTDQIAQLGLTNLLVETVSDRHLVVTGRR